LSKEALDMKFSGRFKKFSMTFSIAAALFFIASGRGYAYPTLQLDIDGGEYDPITQTIYTQSNTLTLYAYLIPDKYNLLTDTYYISAALMPDVGSGGGGSYGSFSFDGANVNVTGDMTYGTAPLDAIVASEGWGDPSLPPHSIFPTFFEEFAFTFNSADQLAPYNTQDRAIAGTPINFTGTGMYYAAFTIDTSLLDQTYGLHFDLYNVLIKDQNSRYWTQFAPFSHDAEKVPEPSSVLILGIGIVLFQIVWYMSRRPGKAGARTSR
jgi:hypothetical protein